jgi:hypothetical protein
MYLIDGGTSGEINIETFLRELDAQSEILTFSHKAKLFKATSHPTIKRLFQDFRFTSEELHAPFTKLSDLGLVFALVTMKLGTAGSKQQLRGLYIREHVGVYSLAGVSGTLAVPFSDRGSQNNEGPSNCPKGLVRLAISDQGRASF